MTNYIQKVATIDSINLKTVAQTTLYTVPSGKSFVPTMCVIRITSASGGTIGATVTVGVGGSFNNFITSTIT